LQCRCESGYCYFIDVHIALGGNDADSRTAFGNPANAANGYDKGTFFIYDPKVSVEGAGGWTQRQLLTIILPVAGGLLLLVLAAFCHRRYRARKSKTTPQVSV
jgi:hypothetical protein